MIKLCFILSIFPVLLFGQRRVQIDVQKSNILWKGTKMAGSGSHEGTLKFISGWLGIQNGKLNTGAFVVDMESMRVTDIPAHETIPLNGLTRHLKEAFEVSLFKYGKLEIDKISGSIAFGNLMLLRTTKEISFPVKKTSTGYETDFTISRKRWKIGEASSWLADKLVDDLIFIKVIIVLR
ncbi:MAG: YceI family protein [Bacteroidota bacterium]